MKYLLIIVMIFSYELTLFGESKNDESDKFSLYLVKSKIDIDNMTNISPDSVELESKPLFTIDDIVSYSKAGNSIILTEEAFKKFVTVSYDQLPFAVCIGKKPLYLGVTWLPILSVSLDAIVAMADQADDHGNREICRITLSAGYPTKSYFTGKDLISSSVIYDSIKKAGKLTK